MCNNFYCHGDTLQGGKDTTPVWNDYTTASCFSGTCHGAYGSAFESDGTARDAMVGESHELHFKKYLTGGAPDPDFGPELGPHAPCYACHRDVGSRDSLFALEKQAIQKGTAEGIALAIKRCTDFQISQTYLLESGSSACMWETKPTEACGTNYQPGVSDHDISVFMPPEWYTRKEYEVSDLCDPTKKVKKSLVGKGSNMAPSLDHIVPLSKGGKHEYVNVQLAHRICNSRKHATGEGKLRLFG